MAHQNIKWKLQTRKCTLNEDAHTARKPQHLATGSDLIRTPEASNRNRKWFTTRGCPSHTFWRTRQWHQNDTSTKQAPAVCLCGALSQQMEVWAASSSFTFLQETDVLERKDTLNEPNILSKMFPDKAALVHWQQEQNHICPKCFLTFSELYTWAGFIHGAQVFCTDALMPRKRNYSILLHTRFHKNESLGCVNPHKRASVKRAFAHKQTTKKSPCTPKLAACCVALCLVANSNHFGWNIWCTFVASKPWCRMVSKHCRQTLVKTGTWRYLHRFWGRIRSVCTRQLVAGSGR